MKGRPTDFPLRTLIPTLKRLAERNVPHAARLLRVIENNQDMRWTDLDESDRVIVQGWSLHLVGLLNRLHAQLQRVKTVVLQASEIEKNTNHLTRDELLRIAEHHGAVGETERANAFRLAAALRTPASAPSSDSH
jgi:hypothetical protein